MHTIYWPKGTLRSRLDATSALGRVDKRRGNRLGAAVVLAGRLVIMYELVKS